MAKITKEAALLYHSQGKPGKIEALPRNREESAGRLQIHSQRQPGSCYF